VPQVRLEEITFRSRESLAVRSLTSSSGFVPQGLVTSSLHSLCSLFVCAFIPLHVTTVQVQLLLFPFSIFLDKKIFRCHQIVFTLKANSLLIVRNNILDDEDINSDWMDQMGWMDMTFMFPRG